MEAKPVDYSFRGILTENLKESNVSCWGVTKPHGPLTKLHFKLPKLEEDEVRIKILSAGLCHTDSFKCGEEWGKNCTFPLVPGHEIIGEIEKTGSDKVTKFKVKDIVSVGVFRDCCDKCEFCLRGDDQLCTTCPYTWTYDPYLGGYSSHIQIKAKHVFPFPKSLDISKAAPLLCAGVTMFAPLQRHGLEKQRCAIIGIGGLGHLGIKLAHHMGMKVVAISTSKDKEMEAKAFGADEFVVSKDPAQMQHLQKKCPVDLVVNTTYVPDITEYMYAVKPGGKFVQVGIQELTKPFVFNHVEMVALQKSFIGSIVGSRKEVASTLDFCAKHNILPQTEGFTWPEFPKAYARLCEGKARYRCVVDVVKGYDG